MMSRDACLEQKIGQRLLIGFPGKTMSPEVAELIRECHIGGVTLFRHNVDGPSQLRTLIGDLQAVARAAGDPPLLVSVDQEGGRVTRLGHPFTIAPSPMAIGATGDPWNAEVCASVLASEMAAMGVNLNLGPVLDVNTNPGNPVIGTRSFGGSPELVTGFGLASLRGHHKGGVLAAAKHFPGHGDTSSDTHLAAPSLGHDWGRLSSVELVPFVAAIGAGVDAIVTAHVAYPGIEERGWPATLSRTLLTGLLRDRLRFGGLIITDALEMDAIAHRYGVIRGAVLAAKAGADMLMVLGGPRKARAVHEALVEAVRFGELPAWEIDSASLRVQEAKRKAALLAVTSSAVSPQGEQRALATSVQQVARDAITLVRDQRRWLPLSASASTRLGIIDLHARHQ